MGKTLVKLHSEKSRNLDTPSAKVRISHERRRFASRSPERYKKSSTAPVTSSFSGKEVKEEKERDVNGNEAASASNLRFYLELKGQSRIPAGTELTIRYNSVFEVTCKAILFLQIFKYRELF